MAKVKLLSGLLPLLATACTAAEEPVLCVYGAAEAADGTTPCAAAEAKAESEEGACSGFAIGEGEVLFVRHTLPADVTTPGKLSLHLTTPCTTSADATTAAAADTTVEIEHVDGVAFYQGIAPPGAGCSLVVTATIANSETRCESKRADAACAGLAAVCTPPEADGAGP